MPFFESVSAYVAMCAGGTASRMAVAATPAHMATEANDVEEEVFDKLALAYTRFEVENFLNGSGRYLHVIYPYPRDVQVYYCHVSYMLAEATTDFQLETFMNGSGKYPHVINHNVQL
ncbi:unnamed protein product [Vitrella brassicaformis CCMP3155]|uniref:Uncharacterized protein n=1 Tax=Vitrella brassicaformis (strain CCMP3155) TaxID=1169540 RepID=A0A0G4FNZ6_VITBC|nr:unnamed protein product [Vitrella brassicaformis CCMP3155]|eukprot:CEM15536.1 unnamed protein product [Vitrella brassicaformis CCMP3155]